MTWENCSLRKWLNGVFISSTFEPDEQAKLQSTTVTADKNPSYTTTSPGKDTKDKVFLLSIAQINTYLKANPEKTCQATAYAIRKGAYTTSGNENCRWWLRSPGAESDLAAYIKVAGGIDDYGKGVSVDNCTIRPAMWISLG